MVKKSIKKRISRHKRTVRSGIVQRNIVGTNVGTSARDALIQNRAIGLVPQAGSSFNPQFADQHQKLSEMEKRNMEERKRIQNMEESMKRETQEKIELQKKVKGLSGKLKREQRMVLQGEKNRDKIESLENDLEELDERKKNVKTDAELLEIKRIEAEKKAELVKLQTEYRQKEIQVKKSPYINRIVEMDADIAAKKSELNQMDLILQKYPDDEVARKQFEEKFKEKKLLELRDEKTKKLWDIQKSNYMKQIELNAHTDPGFTDWVNTQTAQVDEQISKALNDEAWYKNQEETRKLEEAPYHEKVKLLKNLHAKKVQTQYNVDRMEKEKQYRDGREKNLDEYIKKNSDEIGKNQVETEILKRQKTESGELDKNKRQTAKFKSKQEIYEAVTADDYYGNDPDIIRMRDLYKRTGEISSKSGKMAAEGNMMKEMQDIQKKHDDNIREQENLKAQRNFRNSSDGIRMNEEFVNMTRAAAKTEAENKKLRELEEQRKKLERIQAEREAASVLFGGGDRSSDDQLQIALNQTELAEREENIRREIISKINELIRNSGNSNDFVNQFVEMYPEYEGIILTVGSLNELKVRYQRMLNFFNGNDSVQTGYA